MNVTYYKPTHEIFYTRKEAKQRLGENGYRKLLKTDDLIIVDIKSLPIYEVQNIK